MKQKYWIGLICLLLSIIMMAGCSVLDTGDNNKPDPTPTPSSTGSATPTPTLSPEAIYVTYKAMFDAAIGKAQAGGDQDKDDLVDLYQCTGAIGGTFEYKIVPDINNGTTSKTYKFNQFNETGTTYNCPSGVITQFIDPKNATQNYWDGRVEFSGSITGYIQYNKIDKTIVVNGVTLSN